MLSCTENVLKDNESLIFFFGSPKYSHYDLIIICRIFYPDVNCELLPASDFWQWPNDRYCVNLFEGFLLQRPYLE